MEQISSKKFAYPEKDSIQRFYVYDINSFYIHLHDQTIKPLVRDKNIGTATEDKNRQRFLLYKTDCFLQVFLILNRTKKSSLSPDPKSRKIGKGFSFNYFHL